MLVAYTAGPYRDARGEWFVRQNILTAEAVSLELWMLGYVVFCPHKNTAHFGGNAPDSKWLAGGLEFVRRSDLLIALPRWEMSSGALAEIELARELRLPIFYWQDDYKEICRYIVEWRRDVEPGQY